jgi:hypothetical protein
MEREEIIRKPYIGSMEKNIMKWMKEPRNYLFDDQCRPTFLRNSKEVRYYANIKKVIARMEKKGLIQKDGEYWILSQHEFFDVAFIAEKASCTKQWIRDLCKRVNFPIKPKYTAKEKDALVRLRWLYADAEKCILYCWKNNVTP